MKSTTKSTICITLLMILFSFGDVKADELIRYTTSDIYCSGSIIRHYKDVRDIVCNNSECPYFMGIKEGNSIGRNIYLEEMDTICDFELFNDTVYFCGIKKTISGGHVAAYGYFQAINLFSVSLSADVYYIEVPEMSMLKALEVGQFASRKHVVAIGKDFESFSKIMDAIYETSYWSVNISDMGADTVSLSDLALTDKYVVVTSIRDFSFFTTRKGRIWYIYKPYLPGESLFPCSLEYVDYDRIIAEKFLVRAMGTDSIFTVALDGVFVLGTHPFTVSLYNGPTKIRDYRIDESEANNILLKDISVEKDAHGMIVLLNGEYDTQSGVVFRSVFYEVFTGEAQWNTHAEAHIYDWIHYESVDFSGGPDHFVSSGSENGTMHSYPYYLKFKYRFNNGQCLDSKYKQLVLRKEEGEDYYPELESEIYMKDEKIVKKYKKEVNIETYCSTIRDDEANK